MCTDIVHGSWYMHLSYCMFLGTCIEVFHEICIFISVFEKAFISSKAFYLIPKNAFAILYTAVWNKYYSSSASLQHQK